VARASDASRPIVIRGTPYTSKAVRRWEQVPTEEDDQS
jgi:hypothetical protein